MNLQISVKNMDLTPRLEKYVENKTERLDRYMPNLVDVRVDLVANNNKNAHQRQVAQVTIRDSRGTVLRAEERTDDIFAAVDAVVDKLYRRIKRFRGKRIANRRAGAPDPLEGLEPLPAGIEAEEMEIAEGIIVRHKQFTMRPVPPEEAIEQMELLGHDFFVFYNSDDDAVNVVYKRHDGNYGILQPDVG
jgi:putative sigma-54 modulation protein